MRVTWLLSLALLLGCPGGGPGDGGEVCDNRLDDDGDDLIDCVDDDCIGQCTELCGDRVDNDGDGHTDCDDTDCDGTCGEICGDARDNDLDGLVDCDDPDCFGGCPELCDDGQDNDGDGDTDCADDECALPTCAEDCFDGRDNDVDGFVDCEDDECDGGCTEDCDDLRDNDGDGDIDCVDRDCDGSCPEACDDGRDNDADGLWDCEDPDCDLFCDQDRDGYLNWAHGGNDCDDSDPNINPVAIEVCNLRDDDCNFQIDEDDPGLDTDTLSAFYPDRDDDGFGLGKELIACFAPDHYADRNDDCDDLRDDVNPSMPEICNDVDDDCDTLVDDADPSVDPYTYMDFYPDRDGDGYGVPGIPVRSCSTPEGYAPTDDDCDDDDPLFFGPSPWLVDGDGDGFGAGAPAFPPDCDSPGPGYGPEAWGVDCDDSVPTVYPGAEEICEDGVDQDCDGRDRACALELLNEVAFDGYIYASMDDVEVDAAYGVDGTCMTSHYPIPDGWEISPNWDGVMDFVADHGWSTHCMLVETGHSYSTFNFGGPGTCVSACGITVDCMATDGVDWWVTSCSRRILIRKPR
jgi:hypothetical protein